MDNTIIDYIKNELIISSETVDMNAEDDLLGSGLIDSLGMMKLVSFIENEFNVKVGPEDMIIENFMTVGHIVSYLKGK